MSKFVKGVFYSFVCVFLLLLLIFAGKERFAAPVLKEYIPELVASRGGPLLRLGKIGGNYLTGIEFREISLVRPYISLSSAKLSSVRFRYSLFDLLSGTDAFLAGLSIDILTGEVEIDLRQGRKSGVPAANKPSGRAAFSIPHIKADDISVILKRRDAVADLRHGSFEIDGTSGGGRRIVASVPEAVVTIPLVKHNPFSFKTELLLSKSGILVERLSVNGSQVTRSARIGFANGGIRSIKADLALLDGRSTFEYREEGGVFRGKSQLKSINIGKIGNYLAVSGLPDEGYSDISLEIGGSLAKIEQSTGYLDVSFTDIGIAGNRIDRAEASVRVTGKTVFIENAVFEAGENRVDIKELHFPAENLSEKKILKNPYTLSGRLEVLLRNVPEFMSMIKVRPFFSNPGLPEHELAASVVIREGVLHITKGYLKSGGSVVDISRADIPFLTGRADYGQIPIAGNGRIRVEQLKDITDILSITPVRGALTGDISVGGTLGSPSASFSLHGKKIDRGNLYFDSLDIDGEVQQNMAAFSKIEALRGDDRFSGSGRYDISKNSFEQTSFSVDVRDVSVYKPLIRADGLPDSGKLTGSASISGSFKDPVIAARVRIKKWKYPKISFSSGEVSANFRNGKTWIKRFALSTSRGDLTGRASVLMSDLSRLRAIKVSNLTYSHKGLNVRLLKPAGISLGKSGELKLNQISFAGGSVRVDIDGRVSPDWELDLNLLVSNGESDDIPKELLPARIFFSGLNFNARLTGTFISPKLSVSGEVEKVGQAEGDLYLKGLFGFELSRSGVYLSQFNFSDKTGYRINLGGRIPFRPKSGGEKHREIREIKVDGDVSIDEISALSGLFFSGPLPSGAIVSRISVRGSPDDPSGELHIHTKDLNLPVFKNFPFVRGVTGDIDIRMDQKKINIDKISLVSDELVFSASGSWRFGKIFEQILNGEKLTLSDSLDTSGELKIRDIGLLARKVRGLRKLEGGVTVKGHLSGPVAKPQYLITLFTKESKLQMNTALPSFADIKGEIAFENKGVDAELEASLGGSPVSLAGTISWDRKPYIFDLRFKGDNILYYRKNGLKVRGNTSLHLSGNSKHPELAGEVAITDSKFVKNVDFFRFLQFKKRKRGKKGFSLFSLKSASIKDAKLDITITSKEPFVVKNSFVRGNLRPELKLTGTGEFPVLEGNIYIDPTIFQLPYGKLRVTGGFLRFLETAPDKPTIDLNAEGKLLGFDILLHAEGPYNEPVVTISSVPPLPEDELLLLVLAGELPKNAAGEKRNGIGLNVAVYLSRSLLLNLFQSDSLESDESILDRFNIEIGRAVTKAGAETVEAQFLIDSNLIGKQEEWFLTSERDRFDDFNSGLRVVFRFE